MSEQVGSNGFDELLASQNEVYLRSLAEAEAEAEALKVSDELGLYKQIDGMAPALQKFGDDVGQFKRFLRRHIGSQYINASGEILLRPDDKLAANLDPFSKGYSLGSFHKAYGDKCRFYPSSVDVGCDGKKITLKFRVYPESLKQEAIFYDAAKKMPEGVKATFSNSSRTVWGGPNDSYGKLRKVADNTYVFSIEATSLGQLMEGYNNFLAYGLKQRGSHVRLDDIALKAPPEIGIGR